VIARAQKLLAWEPRVPLEVGLKATIGYFSLRLSGAKPILAAVPRKSSARAERSTATLN